MKEIADITETYYISKNNGEDINPDRQYRVLNLLDNLDRQLALAYSRKVGSELYTNLVEFCCKTDEYLLKQNQYARHDYYAGWWAVEELTIPQQKGDSTGLYTKFHVRRIDGQPTEFPLFVLSMTDPIVVEIMELPHE